jgi:hypothetical protein
VKVWRAFDNIVQVLFWEVRQATSQRVVPGSSKGESQTVHFQLMWSNEGMRW